MNNYQENNQVKNRKIWLKLLKAYAKKKSKKAWKLEQKLLLRMLQQKVDMFID
ncbi:MAG: hypothetical protein R8M45_03705 [Ghiorsea sp.]